MCSRCCTEYSKRIVRQTQGYCPECHHRLRNMNDGQKNPYPIKHKQKEVR